MRPGEVTLELDCFDQIHNKIIYNCIKTDIRVGRLQRLMSAWVDELLYILWPIVFVILSLIYFAVCNFTNVFTLHYHILIESISNL